MNIQGEGKQNGFGIGAQEGIEGHARGGPRCKCGTHTKTFKGWGQPQGRMQGPIAALSMSSTRGSGAGGRAWDGRQDPSEGLPRFVKAELPDAVLEDTTKVDGAEGSAQQLLDAVRGEMKVGGATGSAQQVHRAVLEETKVDGAKGSAQQLHATVLEEMKVDAGEGSAQQLPDATLEDHGCTTSGHGAVLGRAAAEVGPESVGKSMHVQRCFLHCCALGVMCTNGTFHFLMIHWRIIPIAISISCLVNLAYEVGSRD